MTDMTLPCISEEPSKNLHCQLSIAWLKSMTDMTLSYISQKPSKKKTYIHTIFYNDIRNIQSHNRIAQHRLYLTIRHVPIIPHSSLVYQLTDNPLVMNSWIIHELFEAFWLVATQLFTENQIKFKKERGNHCK